MQIIGFHQQGDIPRIVFSGERIFLFGRQKRFPALLLLFDYPRGLGVGQSGHLADVLSDDRFILFPFQRKVPEFGQNFIDPLVFFLLGNGCEFYPVFDLYEFLDILYADN